MYTIGVFTKARLVCVASLNQEIPIHKFTKGLMLVELACQYRSATVSMFCEATRKLGQHPNPSTRRLIMDSRETPQLIVRKQEVE